MPRDQVPIDYPRRRRGSPVLESTAALGLLFSVEIINRDWLSGIATLFPVSISRQSPYLLASISGGTIT
jgi:hypothetical protein